MSKDIFLRRYRPYLFTSFRRVQCSRPARTFTSSSCARGHDVTHDYEKRVAQLQANRTLAECYPRLSEEVSWRRIDRRSLQHEYGHLKPDETYPDTLEPLVGRVQSVRTAGSKLIFIDIKTFSGNVQAVCQLGKVEEEDSSVTPESFKAFGKLIRKGDFYSVSGSAHRTPSGELSVLAIELPTMLSPSLHQIPEALEDPEARARSRHVDMLVNPEAIQTLQVRHHVEATMQQFFNDRGFTKVVTPLLAAGAGGAAARPFETEATELAGEKLNLRIAPELWLKRLVVGGMDRVYEIGPAFRNEGVDATHNPEFNTCEFYQAYATLETLTLRTEELIHALTTRVQTLREADMFRDLPDVDPVLDKDFAMVEFIPALEEKMDTKLPDLQSSGAYDQICKLFEIYSIPPPSNPTLARLLDALCAHYLEPMSFERPIFIINHPACMSPLSKHITCEATSQIVAARAELFINGREYANMYEEENSPFEQRRKFEEQLKQRETDKEAMELDESYLQALEWGLPPTGGWGCGMDRLVMLFSGRERISDVLTFGSLRNVAGLGSGRRG
ncbi:hypothetical protein DOTSEDRAFT_70224 [Dothistroma septosporum NZE10]|uniref:Lysyl-tRNA synthetase n=1 Tax=Dothistroma septosporum (strain NZE10 / CBS 128990) TaxID=675120 RepID=N1PRS2_DOTSN|nr:hypothetical protein DOTSEDRAFT_70224 [Dothistroma septosporum NZE10]